MIVRQAAKEDICRVAALYVACFSEPPWYEAFDQQEVRHELTEYLSRKEAVFIIACIQGGIIGGAIGFAIESAQTLPEATLNNEQGAFYIAEIFVDSRQRVRGAATRMTDELLSLAKLKGYRRGAVRTSVHQPIIQGMFERRGFTITEHQAFTSAKTIDNEKRVVSDDRIILTGNL